MDMILLDWTRMGRSYCLAGVVEQNGQLRVVRPLPARQQDAPVRNVGWSSFLMDGHSRWEVFELIDPRPAEPRPPHLEDLWVQAVRPRRTVVEPELRRTILRATRAPTDSTWFGVPLTSARSAVYVAPGTGERSLVTVIVPGRGIHFSASWRNGSPQPDYRVTLEMPGLEGRSLPVKDHFLLQRAEIASEDVYRRIRSLTLAVAQMGESVAVRLGLSRDFQGGSGHGISACWLMADGFFSFTDPQY